MSSRGSGLALGAAGIGLLGVGVALLVLVGPQEGAAPRARAANGFTLRADAIALPADGEALPAGPHRDLVEAHCTACHSPAMITGQPPLTPAQWQATVEKMQKAYKAPVPPEAVPGIVGYLVGLSEPPPP